MADRPRAFDLFVLTPLAVAVLAYQLAEPAEIVPPVALALCLVGRAIQDAIGWSAKGLLVKAAVVCTILYAAIETISDGYQVEVFADFIIMLGVVKAFEPRTPRDDGQLLVVSVFIALSAAVSSNRIGTGLLLVVYVFALMYAVMRVQLDAAMWPEPSPRRRRLLSLFLPSVLCATCVAVLAFVALPRNVGRIGPSELGPVTQSVSGFRETVELGRGGLISQDPREVLRVQMLDRRGKPLDIVSPLDDGEELRLRGQVLTEYNSSRGTWSKPEARESQTRVEPVRTGTMVPLKSATNFRVMQVTQFGGASTGGTIFTPWVPISIRFDQANGTLVDDRRDHTLRFRNAIDDTIEYTIRFGVPEGPGAPRSRRVFAEVDVTSVAFLAASEALGTSGIEPHPETRPPSSDLDAVRALETWLRSAKSYTIDPEFSPPGQDPTEWFLTEATSGHCEYFASSLAAMCRAIGIRSRVVTGYLVTEPGDQPGTFRVRRSHAHAWIEAEIGDDDWRTFDATPSGEVSAAAADISPIMRWLSSIESVWLNSFVSFDSRRQSRLSRSLDDAIPFDRLRSDSSDPVASPLATRRAAAITIGLAVGLVSLGVLVWRFRRRGAAGQAGAGYDLPEDAAAARDRLDTAWVESGIPRPRGRTLAAHARTEAPESIDEARRIEKIAFSAV